MPKHASLTNLIKTLTLNPSLRGEMKEIKQNPSFLKFKRFIRKHNLKIAMVERRFRKVWWKEERNENKLNPSYTIS
jgi:hypothetical protein